MNEFINYSHEFLTILYVRDQEKAKEFYKNLFLLEPSLDVPGMTEFSLNKKMKIGLMPEEGIYQILKNKIKHPSSGNGIPRCEIYLFVSDPAYYYEKAVKLGAEGISEEKKRNWGDSVSYCADMDGHILAFARKNIETRQFIS